MLYQDAAGKIWDSWYDGTKWNLKQVNLGDLFTGPAAASAEGPSSFIFNNGREAHVLYSDATGKIWDYSYNGTTPQQINLGNNTKGPAAVGNIFPFVFGKDTQYHILYRAMPERSGTLGTTTNIPCSIRRSWVVP